MIDEAMHEVQLDASFGAEQLPQEPWHGRQCLAALGAWPGGHSARQLPRSWYSLPLGEVEEQLVRVRVRVKVRVRVRVRVRLGLIHWLG